METTKAIERVVAIAAALADHIRAKEKLLTTKRRQTHAALAK
jgi:hypothetical protein